MQPKSNYITYTESLYYEPQSLYLECGQERRVCAELKKLGTKRILVICRPSFLTSRNVVDFMKSLESAGFRVFTYRITMDYSSSKDILAAFNDYMSYNCDTIVVMGGGAEIFCAKMVSAMATNNLRNPVEAEGYGKLKKDISVLCCVGMDNSTSISSNISEFRDENTGRWITCLSNYLVPQIAVIDTDIAMRTITQVSLTSALDTVALGVECCLSPSASMDSRYKACARNAISLVTDNLMDMKENPDDGFLRRKIALAGIYAGMAVRKTGLGYSHVAVHALKSRYGPSTGAHYCRILSAFLKENFEIVKDELADIYNGLVKDEVRPGFAVRKGSLENMYSTEASAEAFISLMDDIYKAAVPDVGPFPKIPEKDVKGICDEIKTQGEVYGLSRMTEEQIRRTALKL